MRSAIPQSEFVFWAHRGRNRAAPENTMAAFELAFDAKDLGIELDVQASADGRLVVIHDDTVDRTTSGRGRVADMSLAALQSLDAGCWFSPNFRNERIPTLARVLAAAKGRCRVNVEIKWAVSKTSERVDSRRGEESRAGFQNSGKSPNGEEGRLEALLLETIHRHGDWAATIVSAFHWCCLERMRSLDGQIALGVIAAPGAVAAEVLDIASRLQAFSIHPALEDVIQGAGDSRAGDSRGSDAGQAPFHQYFSRQNPDTVNHGLEIYPYTVQNPGLARELWERGFGGCFADLPFGAGQPRKPCQIHGSNA